MRRATVPGRTSDTSTPLFEPGWEDFPISGFPTNRGHSKSETRRLGGQNFLSLFEIFEILLERPTCYHTKNNMGAEIVPSFTYFRSLNPIVNIIVKHIIPWSFAEFADYKNLIKPNCKL